MEASKLPTDRMNEFKEEVPIPGDLRRNRFSGTRWTFVYDEEGAGIEQVGLRIIETERKS